MLWGKWTFSSHWFPKVPGKKLCQLLAFGFDCDESAHDLGLSLNWVLVVWFPVYMLCESQITLVCVIQTTLLLYGCHRIVHPVLYCQEIEKCMRDFCFLLFFGWKHSRQKNVICCPATLKIGNSICCSRSFNQDKLKTKKNTIISSLFFHPIKCHYCFVYNSRRWCCLSLSHQVFRLKMLIFFFYLFLPREQYYFNQRMFVFPHQIPLGKEAEHLSTPQRSWGVEEHRVKNKESQSDSFMSSVFPFPYSRHRYGSGEVLGVIFDLIPPVQNSKIWKSLSSCMFVFLDPITSIAAIHQRLCSCLHEPLGFFTLWKWWTTKTTVIQNAFFKFVDSLLYIQQSLTVCIVISLLHILLFIVQVINY